MTHAITVVLKPGYAPIEQYGDVATMAQGAWTDLYALACVVYYAIAGKTPVSSVERLMDDRVEPLAVFAAGRYSDAFLRAIDAALAVRPGDRPQTEREFRALLDAGVRTQPSDPPQDSGRVPYATMPGTLAATPTARPAARREPAPSKAVATPTAPPRSIAPPSPGTAGAASQPGRNAAGRRRADRDGRDRRPVRLASAARPGGGERERRRVRARAGGLDRGAFAAAASARGRVVGAGPAPVAASSAPVRAPFAVSPVPVPAPLAASPVPASAALRSGMATRESLPAAEAPIDPSTRAAPLPRTPLPVEPATTERAAVERATIDGEAASGVAAAPARPARPRREPPPPAPAPAPARVDDVAVPKPPAQRAPTVSARCSDILQKASLEPLTATEAAYLKRECR